jgi:C_GCAxxG_C_C family probable redox protein
MGYMQDTCGAVAGAFMVIGLKYGQYNKYDSSSKETTHQLVREFVKRFKSKNESINCRELIDIDISTSKGLAEARSRDIFTIKCSKYVRDAAKILENLLEGEKSKKA